MANEDPDLNSIIQAMLRECRKETILYKIEAIRCTGDILEAHESLDRFEEISSILSPILQKVHYFFSYIGWFRYHFRNTALKFVTWTFFTSLS